jgi:hypothetical protein
MIARPNPAYKAGLAGRAPGHAGLDPASIAFWIPASAGMTKLRYYLARVINVQFAFYVNFTLSAMTFRSSVRGLHLTDPVKKY